MFRDWKKFEQLAREVLVKKSCALLSAPDVNVNISVLDKNGNRLPITAKCYKAGNEGSDILIHDDRPIVGQKILAQVKDYTSECGEIAMVRAFANKLKKRNPDMAKSVKRHLSEIGEKGGFISKLKMLMKSHKDS